MPRVRVVLPAALSPAMASMTGRGGSGAGSLRRSRISLSGISLVASRLTPAARQRTTDPALNWTFTLIGADLLRLPPAGESRGELPAGNVQLPGQAGAGAACSGGRAQAGGLRR